MGNTSASTKMSGSAMPFAKAASTIREAFTTLCSSSSGMPFWPAAVTITGRFRLLANSNASTRSNDAELSRGRPASPWQASSPAWMISMLEESMLSGTGETASTVRTSQRMASIWSWSFSEISSTLRSRKSAPAFTWRWTSARMYSRLSLAEGSSAVIASRTAILTCFTDPSS